ARPETAFSRSHRIARPGIDERDRYITTDVAATSFQTTSGETYPIREYKPLSINDPVGNQWWTTSTGLETAWDIGPGERLTIVAVIDTGFALEHEEFTGRWAQNSGEQGPTTE